MSSLYLFFERLFLTVILENPAVLKAAPPRTYNMKEMYRLGFTRVIIFWMLSSSLNRPSPIFEFTYTMASIASWSALVSFHAVLLVDSTAHSRLASNVGFPLWLFTLGNIVVHVSPCVQSLFFPPRSVILLDGWVCGMVHLLWGFAASKGTFNLDHVYCHNKPEVWRMLWCVALGVCFAAPVILKMLRRDTVENTFLMLN